MGYKRRLKILFPQYIYTYHGVHLKDHRPISVQVLKVYRLERLLGGRTSMLLLKRLQVTPPPAKATVSNP